MTHPVGIYGAPHATHCLYTDLAHPAPFPPSHSFQCSYPLAGYTQVTLEALFILNYTSDGGPFRLIGRTSQNRLWMKNATR